MKRKKRLKQEDLARALREEALAKGEPPVPDALQDVTKERITEVLRALDLASPNRIDAVFALLDDERRSWFSVLPDEVSFCAGASTGQIGCHVGILQRGRGKLDREGRDSWVKPFREIGAVHAIYLDPETGKFVDGHPVAKSPNLSYRLAPSFVAMLRGDEGLTLDAWSHGDAMRQRLRFRAEQAEAVKKKTSTPHVDLIRACCDAYAPKFLPGYEVLYIDDADGDRITDAERARLAAAGIEITLDDAMPDVLLWKRETDELWIIEAVTSDGEVDQHKVDQVRAFADRNGKKVGGFTTAYPTWKKTAAQQAKEKNLAVGSYIWIREDAAKHFLAESFEV